MAKATRARTIPQAQDAERAVVGSILQHRDVIMILAPILRPADFQDPALAAAYQAALNLYDRGTPPDLVTVTTALALADVPAPA